jgi:hypothetical protein
VSAATEAGVRALRGRGAPLSTPVRRRFEAAFGRGLGGVRVHTGSRAASLASALDARAFAVGSDVAFAPGEYAPGTARGDRLLAHELTHVVQSGGSPGETVRRQGRDPGSSPPTLPDPDSSITIDLLDPLNSSAQINGVPVPSPRSLMDFLNGLAPRPRTITPGGMPPVWPPAISPEDMAPDDLPRAAAALPAARAPRRAQRAAADAAVRAAAAGLPRASDRRPLHPRQRGDP